MKNIFTNIYQVNPIATLFKELYFPLKSKTISESSPPVPTTIAKFFEIVAYHFDQVYKERLLILSSSFPSNSLEITTQNPHDLRFQSDLEKFAKERGLYRIIGEKDPIFQSRIINAHRFLLASPTLSGLKDLITSILGEEPPKFIIRELYKEDWILGKDVLGKDVFGNDSILKNQNWILGKYSLGADSILGNDPSFYFIVDFESNKITLEQKKYLNNIINLYKPAHIGFHIKAFIQDNWILDDKSVELIPPQDEKLGINTYLEHR